MKSILTKLNQGRWSIKSSDWRGYSQGDKGLELDVRVRKAIDFLPEVSGGLLLDIGCSDGVLSKIAAEKMRASIIVGVDIAHLNEAKKKGVDVISFDLNSGLHLPFREDVFNAVICGGTLEHLLDTDTVIEEVKRILKPDGVFVLSVPRIDSLLSIILLSLGFQPPSIECSLQKRYGTVNRESQVSGHVSHYTKRALLEMLRDHGLKVTGYAEAGIYSSWLLAQKAVGRRPGFNRIMLWLLDLIPFKRDVCIVKATKSH